jgi:uncharacterized membrane protein YhfC
MVSTVNLIAMGIQILLSIIVPVVAIIYLARKKTFSWKAFGIGILVFIVFALILEPILHRFMIDPETKTLKWSSNLYLFALYGGLAAGVFEEMGRFLAFKFMLKKERSYTDGLSFGLGHGGIEALLIGALSAVNALVLAIILNAGMFDEVIGSTIPADQATLLKSQIIDTGFWMYILGGIERIFAVILQIAFSLIVLLGVARKKFRYVIAAIGLHAFVDFFAVLYQVNIIPNIFIIEGIVMVFSIVAAYFIYRAKRSFS